MLVSWTEFESAQQCVVQHLLQTPQASAQTGSIFLTYVLFANVLYKLENKQKNNIFRSILRQVHEVGQNFSYLGALAD
jgi:hypothetical protein